MSRLVRRLQGDPVIANTPAKAARLRQLRIADLESLDISPPPSREADELAIARANRLNMPVSFLSSMVDPKGAMPPLSLQ
jgi:hypothetical protein